MKKHLFSLILMALMSAVAAAQTDPAELISAVVGAASVEELDEETMEHYRSVLDRKLAINLLPSSRLRSSGLFSRYQAASLADYISRNGDVLSAAELSMVDGFNREFVDRILPFISFRSAASPGYISRSHSPVDGEFVTRMSAKASAGSVPYAYSSKLKFEGMGRFDAGLSLKSPYGATGSIETVSGCLSYRGRGNLSLVTVGDYNARFGQGLLMWSGFSLSGFSSAASFARHPGGIAPAYTLNPSSARRGAAVELTTGHLMTTLLYDISGLAAANATYLAHRGQWGMTVLSDVSASMDARWNLGKWDVFGECAYSHTGAVASVAGVTFNPAYQRRVSLLLRHYPAAYQVATAAGPRSSTRTSDESGIAVAADMPSWSVSADFAVHPAKRTSQTKIMVRSHYQLVDWLSLDLKGTFRYKPQDTYSIKGELRPTLSAVWGVWQLKTVAAVSACKGTAWMTSCEGGYLQDSGTGRRRHKLSAYIRAAVFMVDDWDDRIYVYERDIPGSFTVPAYYGRGYTASAVIGSVWGRLGSSARLGITDYPFMRDSKDTKLEAKLLISFTL